MEQKQSNGEAKKEVKKKGKKDEKKEKDEFGFVEEDLVNILFSYKIVRRRLRAEEKTRSLCREIDRPFE